MRKRLILLVLPLVLLAACYGGWNWWHVWRFEQSTDDAYIQSDISLISPKIEGYIKEVRVQDNEHVTAGQTLFVIDDRDFAAKVAQADAAVASEEAMVATFGTRHDFQTAMINQAAAAVDAAEAEVTRADLDQKRYVALLTGDVATRQRFETAEADARKATAALLKAKAALEAEKQQLAVLEAQKREEEARLLQARATLQLARNDLDNTVIRAPVAGVAGNRAGQTGQYVKPGTQLLSLVPLPQVYVTANFKETQLTLMRPGQPVEVTVDAYPGQTIIGRIDSFAPGSGAQFSLLPPDNATGNFTKIVQRVPVRIALPVDGPLAMLLRPGLSVTVTVDTREAGDAVADGALVGAARAGTRPAGR
jgi:membrane fusion protein (multidrug efflux system)